MPACLVELVDHSVLCLADTKSSGIRSVSELKQVGSVYSYLQGPGENGSVIINFKEQQPMGKPNTRLASGVVLSPNQCLLG